MKVSQRTHRTPLMKPAAVALLFDVEPETVIGWTKTGKLRSVHTPGGQHRFHPADVEALLDPTTPPAPDPFLIEKEDQSHGTRDS